MDSRKSSVKQFLKLKKERVATRCLCCGSVKLKKSPSILMPFVAHRAFDWEPVVIDKTWGLKTIKNGNAYSICKTLYCQECLFLFLDIRFSDNELSNLYKDYRGLEYTSLRELYEPGYSKRNEILNAGIDNIKDIEDFLTPLLKLPVSILDWGGDTGKNTPFKNQNKFVDIYDISNKEVMASATKVTMKKAHSKRYNLIVCSNVLEHTPWPSDVLFDIIKSMNRSSVLYIEVPLENLVLTEKKDLHIQKKHWHEHINFFSERSLNLLVQNVGLKVIDLKRLKVNASPQPYFLFQVACRLK